ncbi:MAG: restriction endonuclease [Bacillota bacterium]
MHNIENIYNNLIANEKLKNGTKYERITAVVYKLLDETNTVFHDLRLRGYGKKAKHQIDVTIEKDNQSKRILVECKEYDKVVGVGIVRDFFGAVSQIQPDEAVVVTTKGFTKGAIDFANDEGIKLAILREAEDSDWDGLIRKVKITADMLITDDPQITWLGVSEEEMNRAKKLLKDHWGKTEHIQMYSEYFYNENFEPTYTQQEVIEPIIKVAKRVPNDKTRGRHEFVKPLFVKMHGVFINIKGFKYEFFTRVKTFEINVDDGGKVALLLFKMLNDNKKHLIFQDQIDNWIFTNKGEVINKI